MNFTKKTSFLMDLRLLVHQKQTSLFISLTFLIMLMSCVTTISATNRILNKINNDLQFRKSISEELQQHNNSNNNKYNYKSKNSPGILNSVTKTNTLGKILQLQTYQQEQHQERLKQSQPYQINEEKFSQPFNNRNEIFNDTGGGFTPIKPQGLDQNYVQSALFTPDGHFRVFEDTSIPSPTTTLEIHKKIHQRQQEMQLFNKIYKSKFSFKILPIILTTTPTISKNLKAKIVKRNAISKVEHNNEILPSQSSNDNVIKNNLITNNLKKVSKDSENKIARINYGRQLLQNATANESNINPFEELLSSQVVKNLQKYLLNFLYTTLSNEINKLYSDVGNTETTPHNESNIANATAIATIQKDVENEHSLQSIDNLKRSAVQAVTSKFDKDSYESFDKTVGREFRSFVKNHFYNMNVPRAMETGRLFIFKGLKKLLWPLFIGVQIAKSILLALFLPSILGSLGKIVGKGLVQVSGFNHPSETVSDLDFKDNSFNMMNDDNNKYVDDYSYPSPEASQNHFTAHLYEKATNNMNNALSRFGYGDNKKPHTSSSSNKLYLDTDSKNSYSGAGMNTGITNNMNKNSYKDFLKVPSSSLLLSNYDPFYSPLLSRIDSVFAQLGIAKGQDSCKEKLVCLMYAHPAKYAPYSNLVSAQLSRELNELRKPTSNNEEILRFFKYMKAAKDGQDGVDCEKTYELCKEYQDSDDPVMITTYNDINKLVQARKLSR